MYPYTVHVGAKTCENTPQSIFLDNASPDQPMYPPSGDQSLHFYLYIISMSHEYIYIKFSKISNTLKK